MQTVKADVPEGVEARGAAVNRVKLQACGMHGYKLYARVRTKHTRWMDRPIGCHQNEVRGEQVCHLHVALILVGLRLAVELRPADFRKHSADCQLETTT